MINGNDWRLTNQINYMLGIKMKRARFPDDSKSDHEHCKFCTKKFFTDEESLKEGYCSLDSKWWVCDNCFNDFKEMFKWVVVK